MGTRIVGDWGTSHLRLVRLEDDAVAARVEGPGIGALAAAPAEVLATMLTALGGADGPILLCGMVGSRNGLVEVPYLDCPADVDAWRGGLVRTAVAGRTVAIASGLACRNGNDAPDVIRGEETKVFGLLALDPGLGQGRHVVVMPGTHPKWALLEDGRVTRFHTFFTGELFAHLSTASTLVRAGGEAGGEAEGFAAGLARIGGGAGPLGALFEARAAQLRDGLTLGWAKGFLSGVLIAGEVREGLALLDAGAGVTLVGGPALIPPYRAALEKAGVALTCFDGDEAVLAGLSLLAELEGEAA